MFLGLLTNLEFASVGYVSTDEFGGAHGKASAIIPSWVDSSSSDDDIVLASVQVAWTLQRHFNRGGVDPVPLEGIYIAHCTRSRCSVQTTNASS